MLQNKFNILKQASLIYLIQEDIKNGNLESANRKIDIMLGVIKGDVGLQGVSSKFTIELPKLKQEAENDIGT